MNQVVRVCAVATLLWGANGAAQGQRWSVLTGKTVGTNDNVLHLQVGWPGISATVVHGMSPRVDLGGIFTFNYGFEGDVNLPIRPGLKLQGLLRVNLVDSAKLNLGINFAPGPLFYFRRSTTQAGIAFPLALVFGIPVTSAMNIDFAFELPMFVIFPSALRDGQLVLPVLFGGGIEYFFDHNIAVTFNMRMGPMIFTGDGVADFDFQGLMGVAIKL